MSTSRVRWVGFGVVAVIAALAWGVLATDAFTDEGGKDKGEQTKKAEGDRHRPSADEIFKRVDSDGDGSVSKAEFTTAFEKFTERMRKFRESRGGHHFGGPGHHFGRGPDGGHHFRGGSGDVHIHIHTGGGGSEHRMGPPGRHHGPPGHHRRPGGPDRPKDGEGKDRGPRPRDEDSASYPWQEGPEQADSFDLEEAVAELGGALESESP